MDDDADAGGRSTGAMARRRSRASGSVLDLGGGARRRCARATSGTDAAKMGTFASVIELPGGRIVGMTDDGGVIVTDTKQAWSEVADEFSELGLKLKLHFEETVQARPDETVKKALEDLRDALDQAFTAVGDVVKDPVVKQDVVDVARSLREALSTTFTEASSDLRHCFTARGHSTDTPE